MAEMTNGCMVNAHRELVFREINSLATIIGGIQADINDRMANEEDVQYIVEDVEDYLQWIKDNYA